MRERECNGLDRPVLAAWCRRIAPMTKMQAFWSWPRNWQFARVDLQFPIRVCLAGPLMPLMPSAAPDRQSIPLASPRRQLTLFDSTSIIVGIIIGTSIFSSMPDIAGNLPSLGWLVGVWVVGAIFCLVGSLCYAELATAYPKEGGDYAFLTEAFGRKLGFLFAWAQFWIVRPSSVGAGLCVCRLCQSALPASGPLSTTVGLRGRRRGGAQRHQPAGRACGEVDAEPARLGQIRWSAGHGGRGRVFLRGGGNRRPPLRQNSIWELH